MESPLGRRLELSLKTFFATDAYQINTETEKVQGPMFNDHIPTITTMYVPMVCPLSSAPCPLSSTICNAWAVYTLIYTAAYCAITLLTYLALPWVTRLLAAKLLDGMGETVCADLKKQGRELLGKGREYAMSGPQSTIVGHLVEPYLERLADWMLGKLNQYQGEKLGHRYADVCVDRLRRYRMAVSLAVAQAVMTLLSIGYLFRGVF